MKIIKRVCQDCRKIKKTTNTALIYYCEACLKRTAWEQIKGKNLFRWIGWFIVIFVFIIGLLIGSFIF